jgi:leader peptidase (prepilin peptidase)/N-methyltransferase
VRPAVPVTAALAVVCGVGGVAIGSFLNVVIHRVPRRESIVSPHSHCPGCAAVLANRDNVPILSWVLLRGRCRTCAQPISVRYPLVELVCGALFAGAALRFGLQWALPAFLVLTAGLLALACTDIEHFLLPKRIVYPLLGLVGGLLLMAAAATGDWDRLAVAVVCGLAWSASFFAINLVDARLLAFGDVRLALVLGLGLGWLGVGDVLLGFFAANLIGAVIGMTLIIAKRTQRTSPLPYGVFLTLGAYLAIYAGPWIPQRLAGI